MAGKKKTKKTKKIKKIKALNKSKLKAPTKTIEKKGPSQSPDEKP